NRTIEIPAAVATIRTNNEDLILIGIVFNSRYFFDPVRKISAIAMQQIHNGELSALFFVRIRLHYHTFEFFMHSITVNRNRINSRSFSKNKKDKQENDRDNSFHRS